MSRYSARNWMGTILGVYARLESRAAMLLYDYWMDFVV
jgi:hypothetical protein